MENVLVIEIYNDKNESAEIVKKISPIEFSLSKWLQEKNIDTTDSCIPEEVSDSLIEVFSGFMPRSSVLSVVYLSKQVDTFVLKKLLNSVFISLKALYRPIMRQKGASILLLCNIPVIFDGLLELIDGIEALVKVSALELARKKVSVNFLVTSNSMDDEKMNDVLEYLLRPGCYLTGQRINGIEEKMLSVKI